MKELEFFLAVFGGLVLLGAGGLLVGAYLFDYLYEGISSRLHQDTFGTIYQRIAVIEERLSTQEGRPAPTKKRGTK